jgi:molecular chaperone HscB
MNYFELFGYAPGPEIDRSDLARRYFELQRKYHPDMYATATEEDKEKALQLSAAANQGLAIFKDEDKTIEYFLNYSGVLESEEKFQLPPDFLLEMMELNEMAEEDTEAFRTAAGRFESELLSEVRELLEKCKQEAPDTADLHKLKLYHFKKKYLNRILERLED